MLLSSQASVNPSRARLIISTVLLGPKRPAESRDRMNIKTIYDKRLSREASDSWRSGEPNGRLVTVKN